MCSNQNFPHPTRSIKHHTHDHKENRKKFL
jgi:hypothetical protein